jgi:hypothetical protein
MVLEWSWDVPCPQRLVYCICRGEAWIGERHFLIPADRQSLLMIHITGITAISLKLKEAVGHLSSEILKLAGTQ